MQSDRRTYRRPREPENTGQPQLEGSWIIRRSFSVGETPDHELWNQARGMPPTGYSEPDVGCPSEGLEAWGCCVHRVHLNHSCRRLTGLDCDIGLSTFRNALTWMNMIKFPQGCRSCGISEKVIRREQYKVSKRRNRTVTDVTDLWFVLGDSYLDIQHGTTAAMHTTGPHADQRNNGWCIRFNDGRIRETRFTALERSLLLLSDHARYRGDEESHMVNDRRTKNDVRMHIRRPFGGEHDLLKSYSKALKT